MLRRGRSVARCAIALAAALALCACSGSTPPSASDDGGAADAQTIAIAPPAPPALTPCPTGWREVGGDPIECDPWPDTGRADCTGATAHFPGGAGCEPIGAVCPEGDFPADLPASSPILYVRAGAPEPGAGTEEQPFATIATAMLAAPEGAIVALAKGTYAEAVRPRARVTLWGACAAETRIEVGSASLSGDQIVTITEPGVAIRNVTISGAREGIAVAGPRGDAEISGVLVDRATRAGIAVGPSARVTGTNVVVRDTQVALGAYGYGLAVGPGSTVDLSRVALERNTSSAMSVLSADVSLGDVVLAGSLPQPRDGQLGVGVEALGAAHVTLRRAAIEGNAQRAVYAYEPGTSVTIEDGVLRATRPGGGSEGRGLFAHGGAHFALDRVLVADSHEVAILLTETGTSAELRDVLVRDVAPRESDDLGGAGVALLSGSQATLERVVVRAAREIGVAISGGSSVSVTDLVVRDIESRQADGDFGTGLHAQGGASIEATRVRIERTRQSGVTAIEPGSRVVLSDVEVLDVRETACAAEACPELGIGDGVLVAIEADVVLTRFRVSAVARAGVHVGGGTMDLHEGEIVNNPIGAAVQVPGFDVTRLQDRVLYRGNARNLEATALSLPAPSTGF